MEMLAGGIILLCIIIIAFITLKAIEAAPMLTPLWLLFYVMMCFILKFAGLPYLRSWLEKVM